MSKQVLEYIWLDGYDTKNIRSKIKIVDSSEINGLDPESYPEWGFDGSSTQQAPGKNSDVILKPVRCVHNPIPEMFGSSEFESIIVLCDLLTPDRKPHESSHRAELEIVAEKYKKHKTWFAFEQEYTMYDQKTEKPYNWPSSGFPSPQGKYYCGVGSDVAWGREISNKHLEACLRANISIAGTNAEVMPSQWEYQTGPLEALEAADTLWISRFLINRIAEEYNVVIMLDPKPIKGDWNGAGCHTNFSTIEMRENCPEEDWTRICKSIGNRMNEHIDVYGNENHERLTGDHETCNIEEFSYGISDRGASIRIPPSMVENGKGYLEDRRPAANINPYTVCKVLLESVCGSYEPALI